MFHFSLAVVHTPAWHRSRHQPYNPNATPSSPPRYATHTRASHASRATEVGPCPRSSALSCSWWRSACAIITCGIEEEGSAWGPAVGHPAHGAITLRYFIPSDHRGHHRVLAPLAAVPDLWRLSLPAITPFVKTMTSNRVHRDHHRRWRS